MGDDAPLIWTSRGNLPLSELTYQTAWEYVPNHYMKFMERYLAADGIVVKESAHVYSFQGVAAEGVANPL
jgi:hypothetical protein